MKFVAVFVLFAIVNSGNDTDKRKYYGFYYQAQKCKSYSKTFKCLTTCKSIGFEVLKIDSRCKCSCHVMKTTTILPFFKFKTNGTTRTVQITYPPSLFEIAGTLYPKSSPTTPNITSNVTVFTCPTFAPANVTSLSGNSTGPSEDSNSTSADVPTAPGNVNGSDAGGGGAGGGAGGGNGTGGASGAAAGGAGGGADATSPAAAAETSPAAAL